MKLEDTGLLFSAESAVPFEDEVEVDLAEDGISLTRGAVDFSGVFEDIVQEVIGSMKEEENRDPSRLCRCRSFCIHCQVRTSVENGPRQFRPRLNDCVVVLEDDSIRLEIDLDSQEANKKGVAAIRQC